MPNALLSVPHYEQSRDGACLPSCAQMVLAYWGECVTETDLARLLGTQMFGTAISNSSRLARLGYTIKHGRLDLDQIREQLSNAVPVIVRPWTGFLDYWDVETSHVVVVVGLDETYVYLNDPSFSDHPQRVLHDGFLAAWAEFDETAVVILPTADR